MGCGTCRLHRHCTRGWNGPAVLRWLLMSLLCGSRFSVLFLPCSGYPCRPAHDTSCQAHAVYHVRPGDRVQDISKLFDDDYRDVASVNKLDLGNLTLLPGQRLYIPLACHCDERRAVFSATVNHVIAFDGETVESIASVLFQNLSHAQEIANASGLTRGVDVQPGQTVSVPISCGCNSTALLSVRTPSFLTYVVGNDTDVRSIAQTFGSSERLIFEANAGAQADQPLDPGTRLVIPAYLSFPARADEESRARARSAGREPSLSIATEPPAYPGNGVRGGVGGEDTTSTQANETTNTTSVSNLSMDTRGKGKTGRDPAIPFELIIGILAGITLVLMLAIICAMIFIARRVAKGTSVRTAADDWERREWAEWSTESAARWQLSVIGSRALPVTRASTALPVPQLMNTFRRRDIIHTSISNTSSLEGFSSHGNCAAKFIAAGVENGSGGNMGRSVEGSASPRKSAAAMVSPALTVFTYKDLMKATDRFSELKKIAEGSYGSTYRGLLQGRDVTVKKLKKSKAEQFQSEMEVMSRVHHCHVLALVGYCVDRCLMLVHEFAEKGSLNRHLHSPSRNGFLPLPWSARVQIAVDISSALEYLHERSWPGFIHRSISSRNIFLDKNMRAKTANFGLSKRIDWKDDNSTLAINTAELPDVVGYMAPECLKLGQVSTKADVYSFGVVLLELLSGQEAVSCAAGSHIVQLSGGPHCESWALDYNGSSSTVVAETSGSFAESDFGSTPQDSSSELRAKRPVMQKRVLDVEIRPYKPAKTRLNRIGKRQGEGMKQHAPGNEGCENSNSYNLENTNSGGKKEHACGKILSVNGSKLRLRGLAVEVLPVSDHSGPSSCKRVLSSSVENSASAIIPTQEEPANLNSTTRSMIAVSVPSSDPPLPPCLHSVQASPNDGCAVPAKGKAKSVPAFSKHGKEVKIGIGKARKADIAAGSTNKKPVHALTMTSSHRKGPRSRKVAGKKYENKRRGDGLKLGAATDGTTGTSPILPSSAVQRMLRCSLVSWIVPAIRSLGSPSDVVCLADPDMRGQYPPGVVAKMADLAVRCVQENPQARPNMSRVAYELDEILLLTRRWEALVKCKDPPDNHSGHVVRLRGSRESEKSEILGMGQNVVLWAATVGADVSTDGEGSISRPQLQR